jgi:hypothetical protein
MPYCHVLNSSSLQPHHFLILPCINPLSRDSMFKIQTVVCVHTIVAEVSASFKRTPPGYGYD